MIFIISKQESNLHKLFNQNKSVTYLESLCSLKRIKDKHNIIIIDNITVNSEGIIEDFNYFFEEILISIKIDAIISNTVNSKLLEIAKFHNVPLIII